MSLKDDVSRYSPPRFFLHRYIYWKIELQRPDVDQSKFLSFGVNITMVYWGGVRKDKRTLLKKIWKI